MFNVLLTSGEVIQFDSADMTVTDEQRLEFYDGFGSTVGGVFPGYWVHYHYVPDETSDGQGQ